MRQPASYPKTYVEVIRYEILGQRSGRFQNVKSFTPEEWFVASRRPDRRRCYYRNFRLHVRRLDNGEEMIFDHDQIGHGYSKRPRKQLAPGVRLKIFSHPRDRRPWRFKFLGE